MIRPVLLRRFAGACLLVAMVATASYADTTSADRDKQIADLEKQLLELQGKLKALKDAPAPKKIAADSEVLPEKWVNQFSWRPIGPATMGGRITSLAVWEADPTIYYVATASGGLLKTTNNGITFEHLFDREAVVSIGAVAVAPSNKDVVWVGTGEANPRNSVSWGDGVYKSTDGGKTWKNMGLKKSFQVGAIVIHPKNPDVVYVGALGRLYGPGGDRGLFKTEDGGKTWKSILTQLDDKTGVIDIVMNPAEPETLMVAAWERQRDEFDSHRGDAKAPGGTDEYAPTKTHAAGSAIYRTTDGGKSFQKITKGLPTCKLGRIGLDYSRKNPKNVFAIVDSERSGMGRAQITAYAGFTSGDNKGAPGVFIEAVTADMPAAKGGLKDKDVLIELDGKPVKDYEDMLDEFVLRKPGDKAKFTVLRGKDKVSFDVTFGNRPGVEPERPLMGVMLNESAGSVEIGEVSAGGNAAKGGIQAGDKIKSLDGKAVTNRNDFTTTMRDKKIGDKLKVVVVRNGKEQTLELTLASAAPNDRPWGGGDLGGNRANVQAQQGREGFQTGGLYKSTDGGESWTRINSINPRPFYFSVVRVDPTDENTIWVLGVNLARSTDGGKEFTSENLNRGVHSDQHALWIDPKNNRHLIMGTDGGFYQSYDRGERWDHMAHAAAIGQFYHVTVDNRKPYRVYGGLQDNGSWGAPNLTARRFGPTNDEWASVGGGDGFVCRVDPNDPDLIYTESQDGRISRQNLRTGTGGGIRPRQQPGTTAYRFNWNTPFILSNHNSSIFYSAGNYVFRSVKQGDDLRVASPEITRTKRGSATALSESPKNADVLWVGTDDGAVWVTRDGTKTWTNVTEKFKAAGLPGPRWVSSIEASKWVEGRAYVVFDGHRSNDEDSPYVFVTQDYGESWTSLRGNLPNGSTRVLREDIVNPDLLYVGTEFAAFASINRGKSWFKINGDKGLPTVAVHEFAQPTTANDLVVATHGRSVWVLDVTALRQLTKDYLTGEKTAFLIPSPVTRWRGASGNYPFSESARRFAGTNPPRGTAFEYVLGKKAEKASIKIMDFAGNTIREITVPSEAGLNRYQWDLSRTALGGGRGGRFGGGGGADPDRPQPKGGGRNPKGENPTPKKDAPPVRKADNPSLIEELNLNPLARPIVNALFVARGTYRVVLVVDGKEYPQSITIQDDPNLPPGSPGLEILDTLEELRRLEEEEAGQQDGNRPSRRLGDN